MKRLKTLKWHDLREETENVGATCLSKRRQSTIYILGPTRSGNTITRCPAVAREESVREEPANHHSTERNPQ